MPPTLMMKARQGKRQPKYATLTGEPCNHLTRSLRRMSLVNSRSHLILKRTATTYTYQAHAPPGDYLNSKARPTGVRSIER